MGLPTQPYDVKESRSNNIWERECTRMADTTYIKKVIEPYVRHWLERKTQVKPLVEDNVPLPSGGSYRFDAVSTEKKIVANILSNRARTANGNENTGGVRKALNDLRFLSLLPSDVRRIMIFTDKDFSRLVERRSLRMGHDGIEFLFCSLPFELQCELDAVLEGASKEQLSSRPPLRTQPLHATEGLPLLPIV